MTIDDLNPVECNICDGTGDYLTEGGPFECGTCNGTGKDQRVSELLLTVINFIDKAVPIISHNSHIGEGEVLGWFKSDIKIIENFTGQKWEDIKEVKS